MARSSDSELIDPVSKRVWMKIQAPRRALWTINNSSGMMEGGEDMVSFYLLQGEERLGRLDVCLSIILSLRRMNLQVFRGCRIRHQIAIQPEGWVRRYDHRTLNYVLQFANVTRPWIVDQVVHRFS